MPRSRAPLACCPRCQLTLAGPQLGPSERECDWCARYRSLVANAAHPRKHVRTPALALSRAEFVAWAEATPRVCYSCGIPEELLSRLGLLTQVGHRLRRLGIDRLANDEDYHLGNIAWYCFPCNKAKSSTFGAVEMAEHIGPAIGRIWRDRLIAAGLTQTILAAVWPDGPTPSVDEPAPGGEPDRT